MPFAVTSSSVSMFSSPRVLVSLRLGSGCLQCMNDRRASCVATLVSHAILPHVSEVYFFGSTCSPLSAPSLGLPLSVIFVLCCSLWWIGCSLAAPQSVCSWDSCLCFSTNGNSPRNIPHTLTHVKLQVGKSCLHCHMIDDSKVVISTLVLRSRACSRPPQIERLQVRRLVWRHVDQVAVWERVFEPRLELGGAVRLVGVPDNPGRCQIVIKVTIIIQSMVLMIFVNVIEF